MSNTPETDAFMTRIRGIDGDKHWVPADTAKRLERERDEAIRQRNETNESSVFSCNFYYEEKLKAERERDEAREIAGRLAHFLERPAYSVDEAIARMEALNSYKKQKNQ
jgi:hypothetical protein